MNTITPGPWAYRPHEFDDWGVVKAGNFTICQARDPRYMTYDITNRHREKGTDPWEDNARAIAALPDLIEAAEPVINWLEDAEADLEEADDGYLEDWDTINIPVIKLRALRSALLKAKGEAGQ